MQSSGSIATGSRAKEKTREKRAISLSCLDAEDMIEGGEDKGAGDQTGHEGIHDDLDRPVDVLVRIDEKLFQGPNFTVYHGYFTSLRQAEVEDLRFCPVLFLEDIDPLAS